VGIAQVFKFQDLEPIVLNCNIQEFSARQSDVKGSAAESQTKDANMYTVECEDYILTLVDTPGLGDTQGYETDEQHKKTIITKVQQLTEINAILYVHRASDTRSDLQLKYYLNSFKTMLTNECKDNFVVCFTGVVNPMRIEAIQVLQDVGIPIHHVHSIF
jgi:GTP-binding protein EngB required for normal cell division